MQNRSTITASIPSVVLERFAARSVAINVLMVVGASFLLAISAQIAVPLPFSLVPMTMQPLALLLIGASLGWKRGFAAAALYLLEGAGGLPVFAQGRSGLAVLVGPTAGYLFAFPLAAAISGWFAEKTWVRSPLGTVAGMSLALTAIHLSGWTWLAYGWNFGPDVAFATGVAPFLAGDAVKILLAAILLPSVQRWIDRTH
jgi:biotin transport system substrate-specific component